MKRIIKVNFFLLIICFIGYQFSKAETSPKTIGPRTTKIHESSYSNIFFVSSKNGFDQRGNGSKEQPWQTIQFALSQIRDASSTNRYAICVAEGTYTGNTIVMKPYIDLYGGFDVTDWQRDIYKYPSVLSGNGKRRVIIGADSSRLDGFIVSKGIVRGKGGGMYCDGVSPTITNNIFTRNKTLAPIPWKPKYRHEIANDGGAIYCQNDGSPVIENNLFIDNATEVGRGAGIAFYSRCTGRIANNVFLYNKAGLSDPLRSSDGGAISIFNWSSPVIENNVILANKALAKNDGGGIFAALWCSPEIKGNIIVGNFCGDDGGGLFIGGQEHRYNGHWDPIPNEKDFYVRITNNVIIGNNGAVEFTMESRGLFANNIIAHNGGTGIYPAGVYFKRSEANIVNNTIFDPFLLDFSVFDGKEKTEGLKPSTIKNNRIWGCFELEADAVVIDNFIKDVPEGQPDKSPEILNDWIGIKADAVFYNKRFNKQIFTTKLFVSEGEYRPDELVNRVIKAGNKWGVVKSNDRQTIEVWGELTGKISFLILPTYCLK